ncbi:MAG: transposase [Chitinophagaceae bacterium]|nr:transposase [Chitinophagaceae bacterium]
MSDKFQNKYRIASTRLQNWDYRWNAPYFITICTQNREKYFGEIENGKMILSKQGMLADVLWYEIQHHAKNIDLDEFVVMPNHIHGILILNGNDGKHGNDGGNNRNDGDNVETRHALSLQLKQPEPSPSQPPPTIGQQRFQNQGKNSVSSIIGSYKSAVTKHANRLDLAFGWQARFHEHIIRDEAEYRRIKNYIANNPAKWEEDKFYK